MTLEHEYNFDHIGENSEMMLCPEIGCRSTTAGVHHFTCPEAASFDQPIQRGVMSDVEIDDGACRIMRLAHTYACATGSVARSYVNKKDPTDERKHQSKCYSDLDACVRAILAAQSNSVCANSAHTDAPKEAP